MVNTSNRGVIYDCTGHLDQAERMTLEIISTCVGVNNVPRE